MKSLFLSDVKPGSRAKGLFAVAEARQAESRNGPYWSLVLQDATGRMNAKVWSPLARAIQQPPPGLVALVEAKVESYREQTQMVVERFDPVCVIDEAGGCAPVGAVSPEVASLVARIDPADFVASSSRPPAETLAELRALLETRLAYGPWRRFALGALDDPEISARLLAAPAAKSVHHAHAGGLLEHTLSICSLCLEFARRYPQLDAQTLLVAAAFHDFGKAWELSSGLSRDYTDAGMLLGHIHMGLALLIPRLQAAGVPEELSNHFQHIVLSHHGQYEYGSPKLPMTAEAFALHFADNLDAKMHTVAGLLPEDAPEGKWTERVPSLERRIYKPFRTPPGRDPDPVPDVAAPAIGAAPTPETPLATEPEPEPAFEFEPAPVEAAGEPPAPSDDLTPVWDYEAFDDPAAYPDASPEAAPDVQPERTAPESPASSIFRISLDPSEGREDAEPSEPDPEPVAVAEGASALDKRRGAAATEADKKSIFEQCSLFSKE